MKYVYLIFFLFFFGGMTFSTLSAQPYTSYFTGDTLDVEPTPLPGICLMGGATEDDNAMAWWLSRANGGDIVVIRSSGSDGYNDYLFSDLGIEVNSVETLVITSEEAATDPYVVQQIKRAEALWIAGGDQYNYVSLWKDGPVGGALNYLINVRNVPIGGTSAGMAVLGGFYFSAMNGTVTTQECLQNPFDSDVTIGHQDFLQNAILDQVICDTHYDDPDRRGRHVTFMARILTDTGVKPYGIACDEYTAVCIDENNQALVFGGAPNYEDYAYFIQLNCDSLLVPETCEAGIPLDWNYEGLALKVYVINGDATEEQFFDLNDWQTAEGGEWQYWSVENGSLNINDNVTEFIWACDTVLMDTTMMDTTMIDTTMNDTTVIDTMMNDTMLLDSTMMGLFEIPLFSIYPNPSNGIIYLEVPKEEKIEVILFDTSGQVVVEKSLIENHMDISHLPSGIYFIELKNDSGEIFGRSRVLLY